MEQTNTSIDSVSTRVDDCSSSPHRQAGRNTSPSRNASVRKSLLKETASFSASRKSLEETKNSVNPKDDIWWEERGGKKMPTVCHSYGDVQSRLNKPTAAFTASTHEVNHPKQKEQRKSVSPISPSSRLLKPTEFTTNCSLSPESIQCAQSRNPSQSFSTIAIKSPPPPLDPCSRLLQHSAASIAQMWRSKEQIESEKEASLPPPPRNALKVKETSSHLLSPTKASMANSWTVERKDRVPTQNIFTPSTIGKAISLISPVSRLLRSTAAVTHSTWRGKPDKEMQVDGGAGGSALNVPPIPLHSHLLSSTIAVVSGHWKTKAEKEAEEAAELAAKPSITVEKIVAPSPHILIPTAAFEASKWKGIESSPNSSPSNRIHGGSGSVSSLSCDASPSPVRSIEASSHVLTPTAAVLACQWKPREVAEAEKADREDQEFQRRFGSRKESPEKVREPSENILRPTVAVLNGSKQKLDDSLRGHANVKARLSPTVAAGTGEAGGTGSGKSHDWGLPARVSQNAIHTPSAVVTAAAAAVSDNGTRPEHPKKGKLGSTTKKILNVFKAATGIKPQSKPTKGPLSSTSPVTSIAKPVGRPSPSTVPPMGGADGNISLALSPDYDDRPPATVVDNTSRPVDEGRPPATVVDNTSRPVDVSEVEEFPAELRATVDSANQSMTTAPGSDSVTNTAPGTDSVTNTPPVSDSVTNTAAGSDSVADGSVTPQAFVPSSTLTDTASEFTVAITDAVVSAVPIAASSPTLSPILKTIEIQGTNRPVTPPRTVPTVSETAKASSSSSSSSSSSLSLASAGSIPSSDPFPEPPLPLAAVAAAASPTAAASAASPTAAASAAAVAAAAALPVAVAVVAARRPVTPPRPPQTLTNSCIEAIAPAGVGNLTVPKVGMKRPVTPPRPQQGSSSAVAGVTTPSQSQLSMKRPVTPPRPQQGSSSAVAGVTIPSPSQVTSVTSSSSMLNYLRGAINTIQVVLPGSPTSSSPVAVSAPPAVVVSGSTSPAGGVSDTQVALLSDAPCAAHAASAESLGVCVATDEGLESTQRLSIPGEPFPDIL